MKKRIVSIIMVFVILMGGISAQDPIYVQAASNRENTKKVKMKKLSYEFLDLLGYYADKDKLFDFSKKRSRQEAMKFTYSRHGKLNASAQNKLSKQLFGAGVAKVKQIMGEWGCSHPVLKSSKIYKTSAKQYQIKAGIYMKDDDGGCEKAGSAVFFVKRSLKAKYGYYCIKIKISR